MVEGSSGLGASCRSQRHAVTDSPWVGPTLAKANGAGPLVDERTLLHGGVPDLVAVAKKSGPNATPVNPNLVFPWRDGYGFCLRALHGTELRPHAQN